MHAPTGIAALTLIEVLISIVILSMGSVVIMEAFGRMARALAVADHETDAYLFAFSKMAEVEMSCREGVPPEDDEESGSFQVGGQGYQWTLRTVTLSDEPPVKSIALEVAWRRGAEEHARRLETVLRIPQDEEEGS